MINLNVSKFFEQYDAEWLDNFLFDVFGKYHYVHTLSDHGLDCYLSNLRSVSESSPDDVSCVSFYIIRKRPAEEKSTNLYNMVDFKDPVIFITTFKKYLDLKAFL